MNKNRWLSLLLTLTMMLSLIGPVSLAEDEAPAADVNVTETIDTAAEEAAAQAAAEEAARIAAEEAAAQAAAEEAARIAAEEAAAQAAAEEAARIAAEEAAALAAAEEAARIAAEEAAALAAAEEAARIAAEEAAAQAAAEEAARIAAEEAAAQAAAEEAAAQAAAEEAARIAAEEAAAQAAAEATAAEAAAEEASAEAEAPVAEELAEPIAEELEAEAVVVEEPAEPEASAPATEESPADLTEEEAAPANEAQDQPEAVPAVEEAPVNEASPAEDASVEAADEPVDTFRAGLATLTAGDLFADVKCKEALGTVKSSIVIYVTERMSGQDAMNGKDVVKIALNVGGVLQNAYVKYARLTMLTEAETDKYNAARHEDGIEYRDTKLDPATFEAIQPASEQPDEETPEPVEEQAELAPASEPVGEQPSEDAPADTPATQEEDGVEAEVPADPEPTPATQDEAPAIVPETPDQDDEQNPETSTEGEPVIELPETTEDHPVDAGDATTAAITISKQPVKQTVAAGDTVTFSVTAANVTKYQWQYSTDDGTTWKNLSSTFTGSKTRTLSFAQTKTLAKYLYRCVLSNDKYTKYTSTVSATLLIPITITKQPVSISAEAGERVKLSVTATGATAYRWQYTKDGTTWGNLSLTATAFEGADTKTVSVLQNATRATWQFRCKLSNDTTTVYTKAVKIALYTLAAPVVQTPTVSDGNHVTLSWSAVDRATKYTVYYGTSSDQSAAKNVSAGSALTYTIKKLEFSKKYYFWVVASSSYSTGKVSSVKTTTTGAAPTIAITTDVKAARTNETVVFSSTLKNTHGTLAFRWQYSKDEGQIWNNLPSGYDGYNEDTLNLIVSATKLSWKFRLRVIDDNGTWYSNAVSVTFIPDAVVKAPVIGTNVAAKVPSATTVDYDFVTNGDLTINWSASGGNGTYTVKALLLNNAPSFTSAATGVVKTLLNATGTRTSLTVTAAEMKTAKYLKILVIAQDQNYSLNKETVSSQIGIRFNPKAQVKPTVTSPNVSIRANTLIDYDWTTKGDVTLNWSAANGNGKYTVKAILCNNTPSFNAAATGVVKTLYSQTAAATTSLKVTTADMKTARFLKVLVVAQDVNFTQNAATQSFQFALILKPDAKVALTVSASTLNTIKEKTTVSYDFVTNGDLTLSWKATSGNGKYNVKAVLANNAPVFGQATTGVVKTAVSLTNSTSTSTKITAANMKLAKYMKVVITAQDVNYARNGATVTVEYAIKFTPKVQVLPPKPYASPSLAIAARTMSNYDWGTNGDLTISWTGSGGNGLYDITAVLANNQPIFGQATTGVVKTIKSDKGVQSTSFTITSAQMKLARYVKVVITAQDANYALNGGKASVEFSIRFARHVALVIGNSDYSGTANDLKGPANDRTAMAGILKGMNQGWEVSTYANQSGANITSRISSTFSGTTAADICLFYYSGHGSSSGALCGVNDVNVSPSSLRTALDNATKGKVIVILDSCYSGVSINASRASKSKDADASPSSFNAAILSAFGGVSTSVPDMAKAGELIVSNKYYVLTACAKDQTSIDYSNAGGSGVYGGLMTYQLVKSVGGTYTSGALGSKIPGDSNSDKKITLSEAKSYITTEINKLKNERHTWCQNNYSNLQNEYYNNVMYYYYNYGVSSFSEFYYDLFYNTFDQVTSTSGSGSFVMFRR